jgi:hypothetical protein
LVLRLERVVQQLVPPYRTRLREMAPQATIVYSVTMLYSDKWEILFKSYGTNELSLRCSLSLLNGQYLRLSAHPAVEAMGESEKVVARTRLFLDLLEELNQACANYEIPKA